MSLIKEKNMESLIRLAKAYADLLDIVPNSAHSIDEVLRSAQRHLLAIQRQRNSPQYTEEWAVKLAENPIVQEYLLDLVREQLENEGRWTEEDIEDGMQRARISINNWQNNPLLNALLRFNPTGSNLKDWVANQGHFLTLDARKELFRLRKGPRNQDSFSSYSGMEKIPYDGPSPEYNELHERKDKIERAIRHLQTNSEATDEQKRMYGSQLQSYLREIQVQIDELSGRKMPLRQITPPQASDLLTRGKLKDVDATETLFNKRLQNHEGIGARLIDYADGPNSVRNMLQPKNPRMVVPSNYTKHLTHADPMNPNVEKHRLVSRLMIDAIIKTKTALDAKYREKVMENGAVRPEKMMLADWPSQFLTYLRDGMNQAGLDANSQQQVLKSADTMLKQHFRIGDADEFLRFGHYLMAKDEIAADRDWSAVTPQDMEKIRDMADQRIDYDGGSRFYGRRQINNAPQRYVAPTYNLPRDVRRQYMLQEVQNFQQGKSGWELPATLPDNSSYFSMKPNIRRREIDPSETAPFKDTFGAALQKAVMAEIKRAIRWAKAYDAVGEADMADKTDAVVRQAHSALGLNRTAQTQDHDPEERLWTKAMALIDTGARRIQTLADDNYGSSKSRDVERHIREALSALESVLQSRSETMKSVIPDRLSNCASGFERYSDEAMEEYASELRAVISQLGQLQNPANVQTDGSSIQDAQPLSQEWSHYDSTNNNY